MATKTIKDLTPAQIKKIITTYKDYVKTNPSEYVVKFFQTKDLTISIYKTNKVLLQGSDEAIANFMKIEKPTKASKSSSKNMIGMDEVGTGDYFGPIITCSCYLDAKNIEKVKALGVDDSKKLTDENIMVIAAKLRKLVTYKACLCMPKTYNEIIDCYHNTNIVKAMAHNDALTKLIAELKTKDYTIVLDQFASRENYESYLSKVKAKAIKIDIITPKAEGKYLAVACASIFAREAFLNQMHELSKKAGIILPFGSTRTKEIVEAGKKINAKFKLSEFAKLNFEPITKAILNK